jgi:pSer/pThr/pTyr-binding forkhead associated (FHA) protein
MAELTLEVIEGPEAGKTVPLTGTVDIGRDPAAGLHLDDDQASRRHARIRAVPGGAVIEDLGSSNGTFVNNNELYAPTRLTAGDELLIGVSVILLRSAAQIAAQPSAIRVVPPALAAAPRRPTYVDPAEGSATADAKAKPARSAVPELDRLVDARVKSQARLAPLALIVLAALVVVIYLGST